MAASPCVNEFLKSRLTDFNFAFVLSDPQLPDNPICFASNQFYELTGYGPEDIIGRNCRILQGPETERRKVLEVRDAIREDRSCHVCLLNYKKSGEKFWNQFYLAPIRAKNGNVVHYIGIQSDVTGCFQQKCCDSDVPKIAEAERLQASDIEAALSGEPLVEHSSLPCSLLQPLLAIQQSFVLADPSLPDMPIVHASSSFLDLTGYSREEVLGRNCRFLQGAGTDQKEVARLNAAISANPPQAVTVTLLNYRKDGTPFWNALHVAPVRDAQGRVSFFIGVQLDVSDYDSESHCSLEGGANSGSLSEPRTSATPRHSTGAMDEVERMSSETSAELVENGAGHQAPVCSYTGSFSGGWVGRRTADDVIVDRRQGSGCMEVFGCQSGASTTGDERREVQDGLCAKPLGLNGKVVHKGVVGAVRVAVRSLGGDMGLRRLTDDQGLPLALADHGTS